MITWIASYPRSGNTLYRMLLHYAGDVNTYSIYSDQDIVGMGAAGVIGHKQLPYNLQRCRESDERFYIKTHGLPIDESFAIYIIRDVRDVMVSYAHYRQEIEGCEDDFDTILRRLIASDRWGGWSNNVRMWTLRQRVAVVYFKDMLSNPASLFPTATIPSFDELHTRWPKFFRKGKVGGWRDEMSSEIEQLCWERHGDTMKMMGYERR